MTQYIPIICFVAGLLVGVGTTILGLYLGFKASYDIRNHKEGIFNSDGLVHSDKEPGEFDLLEDERGGYDKSTTEV
jgi:ABC-type lipoprotein release transport system permease subunit